MKAPIPVLRIFDEAVAKDHYNGFLGFAIDWEHRFEDHLPLYMQVSRDSCIIHLSEHAGDACPGAAIRIETPDLNELYHELREKNDKYAKPGAPEEMPWGLRELRLSDPFGNRLIFYQAMPYDI